MPTYQYQARDQNGQSQSGIFVADNEVHLRQSLRSRGLIITNYGISSDRTENIATASIFGPKKVKLYDLVVMSRQLASMVRAGVSIVESLDAVAQESSNPTLVDTLATIRIDILSGDSMSVAMAKHPKVFSELYIALVDAGETTGMLEDTLEIAASQLDKQATLREKVRSAMLYPIIVVVASVLVVLFMLMFIVPVFQDVYTQFDAELPAITKMLIFASDVVMNYWYIVLGLLIATVLLLRAYYSSNEGRHVIDKLKLKVPLVGALLRKISVAQFTETFSGTTKAGLPVIAALRVSAGTCQNIIIRDAVWSVSDNVSEGSPISTSLEETMQFPPMVTRMVASGEKSGNLDEMLSEITHFYERDIDHTVERFTRMMEPIMTVIVGSLVLFVLLALYMPVFSLGQVIRRD